MYKTTYCFENIEVDVSQRRLSRNGEHKHLRRQAFQILSYLVERPDRIVGRDELIQNVWNGAAVTDDSLVQCISEIREVLGDSSRNPRFIKTIPKIGYQFVCNVLDKPSISSVSPSDSGLAERTVSEKRSDIVETLAPPRKMSYRWIILSIFPVLVIVSSFFSFRHFRNSPIPTIDTPAIANPRPSIAILGFKNLSGHSEDEWLSTALSDWLNTELAAGEQLRTIPPGVVVERKADIAFSPSLDHLSTTDLEHIRQNTGVDLILLGSYAKLKGTNKPVRVDMRIEDTRTGVTIAAISESGSEQHLFDLISQAGERLRAKLAIPGITHEEQNEVAAVLPSNEEAAELYAEGVSKLRGYDFPGARDLLQKAIHIEPQNAMPHAALSSVWVQLGYDKNAQAEAKMAYDLSSHLPRADRLLIEAKYHEASRDWDAAIRTYTALFSFFPDDLDYGLSLANAERTGGRLNDALQTLAALRKLPPPQNNDPRIDLQEAIAAKSSGDMKRSVSASAKAAEKAGISGASLLQARALLEEARALNSLGEPEHHIVQLAQSAKQFFAVRQDQQGLAAATNYLSVLLDSHGDYANAQKGYEEALNIDERIEYEPGIAAEHINLGGIRLESRDLAGARKHYEEALATYRKISEQDGVALAKQGLGDVYLATGDLEQAKTNYESSLEICREVGDRDREAEALTGLSKIYWREGSWKDARQTAAQAKELFTQLGEKVKAHRLDVELSGMLLDSGKIQNASNTTRVAPITLKNSDTSRDHAVPDVVLTNRSLAGSNLIEAQNTLAMAQNTYRDARSRKRMWSFSISARVKTPFGKGTPVMGVQKQSRNLFIEMSAMPSPMHQYRSSWFRQKWNWMPMISVLQRKPFCSGHFSA